MLRRLLLPAILWLFLPNLAAAGTYTLEPGVHEASLSPAADMFEDTTAALDIAAMASPMYASRYAPVHRDKPNYGFRRSALWFRVSVDFSANRAGQWHLVFTHPIIDQVTFCIPDGKGGWVERAMGDTLPFAEREYRHREFIVPIPRELVDGTQPVTFYVRIAGQGALNVDLRLSDTEGLVERTNAQTWAFGLFYGALALMFIYNLLLWFSTRERAQLHYIVFLGGFFMLFLSLNGFGLQYLWPGLPVINSLFPVFTCVAVWGGPQFTRTFLDVARDNPRLDDAFRWMTAGVWVVFFLGLLLPRHWAYILGTVLPVFFALAMLAAGVFRLRQGYAPAGLFVAGWGVLLFGAILLPLANLGLLPVNTLTEYSPQFGAVFQVVLLSLAIGARMKLLKAENERIQQDAHEKLEGMFAELKHLDADKMRFLHYLSHELNTPLNWVGAVHAVDRSQLDGEARELMGAVEKGQQRMIDLVGTVLRYFDLAGEDASRVALAPVAPMWIVDQLLREQAALIGQKNLSVKNRIPADLVMVANEQRLKRLLGYLVDNALQFSGDGQEVVIDGSTESYGTMGTVSVRDEGRGIDPEHLGRLFEPFFMVGSHHREDGFGLSLPTAKVLATGMGGDIRVRSEGRGLGAEFTLVLPTAAAARTAAASTAAQSPAG